MKSLITSFSSWDTRLLLRLVESPEKRILRHFFFWLSRSADGYLYPVLAGFLFWLAPNSALPFLFSGLIAFSIELPCYWALKNLVRRNRPFEVLEGVEQAIAVPDKFSFPSGHTAAAFIMATLLSSFFPALTIPAFFWASLVGLSRVYLRVHFPSDVLVGAGLGIACALIGQSFFLN